MGSQIRAHSTLSQVDPNTGSQFLLDCVCLLLRVGRPGTAAQVDDDGPPSETNAETLSSNGAIPADSNIPPTVWQQRYLLCHMMLDLIQQPFLVRCILLTGFMQPVGTSATGPIQQMDATRQRALQVQAHACLPALLSAAKHARLTVKVCPVRCMHSKQNQDSIR